MKSVKSFNIPDKAKGIYEDAKKYVSENEKLNNLLDRVIGKLKHLEDDTEERESFLDNLKVLVRMVKSHFSGEYHAFSQKSIIFFVFALLYFITPTDLIPDFIPALGMVDDISLVYYVVKSFAEDVEEYLEWESTA